MLSSVSNPSHSLNVVVAHQGAAVAKAEESALRAIDQVARGYQRTGIEASLRQDDADQDAAGEAANLIEKKAALRANVAVLKTADRMVGTLLDLFA